MTDYTTPLAALAAYQANVILGQNHRYRAWGKYAPGVTTICKVVDAPQLDRWMVKVQVEGTARAAFKSPPFPNEPIGSFVERMKILGEQEKEHERLRDEAAKVGTDVHALIEHVVKGMLGQETTAPVVCEEAIYRFAGWRDWASRVGLKPLASEARLYHSGHDFCGTLDLLALYEGTAAVIDFKPQSAVYTSRRLQLAGYRMAIESMGWPKLRGFINVLPKDGGDITMVEVDPPGPDYDASCAAFLSCLQLYRWNADHEKQQRAAKKTA